MEGRDPEAGLARAHPRDYGWERLRAGADDPAKAPRFRLDLVGELRDTGVEARMVGGDDAQILEYGIDGEIHGVNGAAPMCTARFAGMTRWQKRGAHPFCNVEAVIRA